MTYTFQEVVGIGGYGEEKTYARCKSIRRAVFVKNDDRKGQILGSMLDNNMNTLYIYILFFINLINILNEANPTDVILNALALEFVFKIDEVYATASWWDPGRRWLKAGVMESFIQSEFNFRVMRSARLFSDRYKIRQKAVEKVCDNDNSLFYDVDVSRKDGNNPKFMNDSERFEFYCRQKATAMKNESFEEFTKPSVIFGGLEERLWGLIHKILGRGGAGEGFGVFYRLQYYQTWSRWKKALFMADIPDIEDLFEINVYGNPILKKVLEREKSTKAMPFKNFKQDPINPSRRFVQEQKDVLTFHQLRTNMRFSIYQKDYERAFLIIFDGLLGWLSFAVQRVFPFINLFLFCFAFYCYDQIIQKDLRMGQEGITTCNCAEVFLPTTRQNDFDNNTLTCDLRVLYSIIKKYPDPSNTTINDFEFDNKFNCLNFLGEFENINYDVDLFTHNLNILTIMSGDYYLKAINEHCEPTDIYYGLWESDDSTCDIANASEYWFCNKAEFDERLSSMS